MQNCSTLRGMGEKGSGRSLRGLVWRKIRESMYHFFHLFCFSVPFCCLTCLGLCARVSAPFTPGDVGTDERRDFAAILMRFAYSTRRSKGLTRAVPLSVSGMSSSTPRTSSSFSITPVSDAGNSHRGMTNYPTSDLATRSTIPNSTTKTARNAGMDLTAALS